MYIGFGSCTVLEPRTNNSNAFMLSGILRILRHSRTPQCVFDCSNMCKKQRKKRLYLLHVIAMEFTMCVCARAGNERNGNVLGVTVNCCRCYTNTHTHKGHVAEKTFLPVEFKRNGKVINSCSTFGSLWYTHKRKAADGKGGRHPNEFYFTLECSRVPYGYFIIRVSYASTRAPQKCK